MRRNPPARHLSQLWRRAGAPPYPPARAPSAASGIDRARAEAAPALRGRSVGGVHARVGDLARRPRRRGRAFLAAAREDEQGERKGGDSPASPQPAPPLWGGEGAPGSCRPSAPGGGEGRGEVGDHPPSSRSQRAACSATLAGAVPPWLVREATDASTLSTENTPAVIRFSTDCISASDSPLKSTPFASASATSRPVT